MHRSSSQYPRSRGEKTVVEGKTIPYVTSKSVFGAPSATKLSGAIAYAGERLFHANGWNQQTPWNWTVPNAHDIDYISVVCVGGGGAGPHTHDGASGSGGGLSYKNNIPVSPGDVVAIWVGGGGSNNNTYPNATSYPGYPSYIRVNGVTYATATGGGGGNENAPAPPVFNIPVGSGGTGQANTDGGGNGGYGSHSNTGTRMGGGGAGGYSGNGGNAGPANGYPIAGHPGTGNPFQPPSPVTGQAGSGGAGGGGQSYNSGEGGGGGGGVGLYGEGTSGGVTNAPGVWTTQWYAIWGQGGSTAHNTGLNGYSSRPPSTPISNIPSTFGGPGPGPGYWGSQPPTGPAYNMQRSNNPSYPQLTGDGGFCGGGGCGGHAYSMGGRGGHGAVRIVYGYVGPGDEVPANKRQFPTQNVDKSDQYAVPVGGTVAPANVTIETDGQQLMY